MMAIMIFLLITITVTHSNLNKKKNRTAGNSGAKDAEIMLPLKYLSNIRRTLEIPLINCENSLQFKWSKCVLVAGIVANQNPNFQVTDTKIYVLLITLSTQENN